MKADLTRNTYHPLKHFTRVVSQQGRPQLDADWNEQAAILLGYLRALAADVIGQHGGPVENLGFQMVMGFPNNSDYAIAPGHYYVDGILCELPAFGGVSIANVNTGQNTFTVPASSAGSFKVGSPVLLSGGGQYAVTTITAVSVTSQTITVNNLPGNATTAFLTFTTFLTQREYPGAQLTSAGLFYLDVWERLITYVQDDSIREVALNGADTAARSKLVCQVKQMPANSCLSPDTLESQYQPPNRGFLKVIAQQQTVSADPCVIDPNSSYTGPENQLYRVEVHSGGTAGASGATFKWSRENGSVVFPILTLSAAGNVTTVGLENLGRDDRFGLTENDWVEVESDNLALLNAASLSGVASLLQVQSIDTGSLTITLSGAPPANFDLTRHPLLRRWDQSFGNPTPPEGGLTQAADNAALIVEDSSWLLLENGIQIQFQAAAGSPNQYRSGDYWLIPARVATGNVEWPNVTTTDPSTNTTTTGPMALPPKGVDHHYAPLALLTQEGGITSCQQVLSPLAKSPTT